MQNTNTKRKTRTHIIRPKRHVCTENSSGFSEEVLQILPADAVWKLIYSKIRGGFISFKDFTANLSVEGQETNS